MQIQEIMTSNVTSCGVQANLAEAARLMWQQDCGVVPVTDEAGRLTAVVTDRDICIASATKNQPSSQIRVNEMPHGDLGPSKPPDGEHA